MRWRGLFIFRGGAAAATVGGRKEEDEDEDEDKDDEEKEGEREQTNGSRHQRWRENSPVRVPDCEGLGRRVRRSEEETPPRRSGSAV